MNLPEKLFFYPKLIGMFVVIICLAGCSIASIDSVIHDRIVSSNQNINIQISATKTGSGGPAYGYLAIMTPEDWTITGVDYDNSAMIVDSIPQAPVSSTEGYVWSIWRTANYYGVGAVVNPTVVHATIGSTVGTFTLLYYAGASNCDSGGMSCSPTDWTASSTSEITVAEAFTLDNFSAITATRQPTSAVITWETTGIPASSQVVYSEDTSYSLSSDIFDTSPRVTSHSVSLNNLVQCQSYNYKIISTNSDGITATSSDRTFSTTGCNRGGATVFIPVIPQPINGQTGLDMVTNNGESVVTDPIVRLILNGDPRTIRGYSVSLDKTFTNDSIIPYTSSTVFALPDQAGIYTIYLKYYSLTGESSALLSRTITYEPTATKIPIRNTNLFSRTLRPGNNGDDVTLLQIFLNTHGFAVATQGPGSPGNETSYYGTATTLAVRTFQDAHADSILKPAQLRKGTGIFGAITRTVVNALQ